MSGRPAAPQVYAPQVAAGGAGRRKRLGRALLAAAVVAAYAPALWNGFVWDDRAHIVGNPRIDGVARAAAFYLPALEGPYHRPAVFVSYAVEHALWPDSPFGYHLTNLLLHVANTLLLLSLARRLGMAEAPALVGSALFALHPVQSEAVAYISGRTDLLMTAAALLSCRFLLAAGPPLARGLAAALTAAIAMLSKEAAYALIPVIPFLSLPRERLRERGRLGGGTSAARIALAGPTVIAGAILLIFRPGQLPDLAPAISASRLAAAGQALLHYAAVLLWPADLQIDRLMPLPTTAAAIAVGLVALVAAAMLAAWGLTRGAPIADWTAWTTAFYLPAANLFALYPAIAERALFIPEHNLYAPLAGLGMLASLAAQRATTALSRPRLAGAATYVVLALLAGLTAVRCGAWRDEDRLFGGAVAAGSASPRVWYNYGNALLARGDAAGAATAFAGATERAPHDAAGWSNLGVARQRLRQFAAAERAYRRAIELAPRDAQIVENLGTLLLARGDRQGARAAFAAALRLDPTLPTSRRALAAIEAAPPAP